MRDSFVLYTRITETVEKLTAEQKGLLFQAILDYENGKEPVLDDLAVELVFTPIKQDLDLNNEKWERTRKARSEAGKKGGAPKGNSNASKQAKQANDNFVNQKQAKQAKQAVNVDVYVNDNVNDLSNNNLKLINKTSKEKDIHIPPADADGAPVKEQRHKYGEYQHVLLTDRQVEKLNKDYGEQETKEAITYLDDYIQRKGYKCKDYNLTLRKWVFDAVREEKQKSRGKPKPNAGQGGQADDWNGFFERGWG